MLVLPIILTYVQGFMLLIRWFYWVIWCDKNGLKCPMINSRLVKHYRWETNSTAPLTASFHIRKWLWLKMSPVQDRSIRIQDVWTSFFSTVEGRGDNGSYSVNRCEWAFLFSHIQPQNSVHDMAEPAGKKVFMTPTRFKWKGLIVF